MNNVQNMYEMKKRKVIFGHPRGIWSKIEIGPNLDLGGEGIGIKKDR